MLTKKGSSLFTSTFLRAAWIAISTPIPKVSWLSSLIVVFFSYYLSFFPLKYIFLDVDPKTKFWLLVGYAGKRRKVLPWDVRYKVAMGVAQAIEYLHYDTDKCVVHRDIKPSNILLSSNKAAKVRFFIFFFVFSSLRDLLLYVPRCPQGRMSSELKLWLDMTFPFLSVCWHGGFETKFSFHIDIKKEHNVGKMQHKLLPR